MVAFGKYLRSNQVPEWSSMYIDYKNLKKDLKKLRKKMGVASKVKKGRRNSEHDLLEVVSSGGENKQDSGDDEIKTGTVRFANENSDDDRPRSHHRKLTSAFTKSMLDQELVEDAAGVMATYVENSVHKAPISVVLQPPESLGLDGHPFEPEERAFFVKLLQNLYKINKFFSEQEDFFVKQVNVLVRQLNHLPKEQKALKHARHVLDRALKELYRGLELLHNYRLLNFTGFAKILKKHDKLSTINSALVIMPIVLASNFHTSVLPSVVKEKTEEIYVIGLSKGDHAKGMKQLRGDYNKPVSAWIPFEVGLFLGISLCLLVVFLFVVFFTPGFGSALYFIGPFPIFRAIFLLLFHVWLWGVDVYVCTALRINHVFILKANHRSHLTYSQIFAFASELTVIYFGFVVSYFFIMAWSTQEDDLLVSDPAYLHFSCFFLMVAIFVCPFNILFRSTRLYLANTLKHIVLSPFAKVNFIDFFLADQLTSLVRVLVDLIYSLCFYVTGSLVTNDPTTCLNSQATAAWVVAVLPYWWRMMQCLRRYRDDRSMTIQLWNAGKYLSAIVVTLFNQLASTRNDNRLLVCWIIAAIFSTGYSYIWDVTRDWGFFERGSPNRFLRSKLILEKKFHWVYYVVMVFNLIFRAIWIITISPASFGLDVDRAFVLLAVGAAEIFRRCVWNVFRLENEHLNNVGKYRAVNIIPLPLTPGNDKDSSDEQDDPNGSVDTKRKSSSGSAVQRKSEQLSPIPLRVPRKWSKRKSSQSSDDEARSSRKFRNVQVTVREEEDTDVIVEAPASRATTDTEHTTDKEDNHEHHSSDNDTGPKTSPQTPSRTNREPPLLSSTAEDHSSSTPSSPGLVAMANVPPVPVLELTRSGSDNLNSEELSRVGSDSLQLNQLPASALSLSPIPNIHVPESPKSQNGASTPPVVQNPDSPIKIQSPVIWPALIKDSELDADHNLNLS